MMWCHHDTYGNDDPSQGFGPWPTECVRGVCDFGHTWKRTPLTGIRSLTTPKCDRGVRFHFQHLQKLQNHCEGWRKMASETHPKRPQREASEATKLWEGSSKRCFFGISTLQQRHPQNAKVAERGLQKWPPWHRPARLHLTHPRPRKCERGHRNHDFQEFDIIFIRIKKELIDDRGQWNRGPQGCNLSCKYCKKVVFYNGLITFYKKVSTTPTPNGQVDFSVFQSDTIYNTSASNVHKTIFFTVVSWRAFQTKTSFGGLSRGREREGNQWRKNLN